MSDNLHYNSQRDKDMDERLANPIEEKITCKHCQSEYWESESHECNPIAEIDSVLDRIGKKMDEGDIYLDALSEVIGNLNMRIKVLEKALDNLINMIRNYFLDESVLILPNDIEKDTLIKQAEEQCKEVANAD